MELQFLRAITVCFIVTLISAEDIVCPDNEVPGCESACAPTCQDKNPSKSCTKQCVGPCICEKNYIREGPGGICVPKSCKDVPICKEHEKFVSCPTTCPIICNQTLPTICPKICLRVGCVCDDGYVRESVNGKCVCESKCTFKCPDPNKVYNDCKITSCPGTCSEPSRVCKRCIKECICKEGYLLDETTGQCVEKDGCPKT
ncbi:hypothetical protein Zmor_011465 [Zophobas morio]|uniref:TIL domain-containing protein n=1 Tax=Zophobas morio TaxID=2755281 RepID=A0AA38IRK4_9CUCU|nr:hypothetical protein Zmor_011465 [Zophobas morio]